MGVEPGHHDEPAPMLEQRHSPLEIGLARGVPVNIHALWREITDGHSHVLGLVIDGTIRSQFEASPKLLGAACRGDHSCPEVAGNL